MCWKPEFLTALSDLFFFCPQPKSPSKLPPAPPRLPLPFGVHGLHVKIAGGEGSLCPQPGPPYRAALGAQPPALARGGPRRDGSQGEAERPQATHLQRFPRRRNTAGAREGTQPGTFLLPSPPHRGVPPSARLHGVGGVEGEKPRSRRLRPVPAAGSAPQGTIPAAPEGSGAGGAALPARSGAAGRCSPAGRRLGGGWPPAPGYPGAASAPERPASSRGFAGTHHQDRLRGRGPGKGSSTGNSDLHIRTLLFSPCHGLKPALPVRSVFVTLG